MEYVVIQNCCPIRYYLFQKSARQFGVNKVTMTTNSSDFFAKLTEAHPFISVCSHSGQDYVGIIQNRDELVTTLYDYGAIVSESLRTKFLSLGEIWWWESSRTIPINIFLKDEWSIFKPYIRTFSNKSLNVLHGPVVSMADFSKNRSKRKTVILVKRMP